MTAQTLNLSSLVGKISDRHLELISRDNPDARLEIDSHGHLIFMSPTGTETGDRNSELMSPSDNLDELQNKMKEYINCGVRLGWLINPDDRQVEIYRQVKDREILDNPRTLSGEDVMPNLVVSLGDIFN